MTRIALLRVRFQLPGCHSLKEKRQRLGGLRDRLGKRPELALCESGRQDEPGFAEWSFVAIGATHALVERSLHQLEESFETLDANIVASELEWL